MRWLTLPVTLLAIVWGGCNFGGEGDARALEAWATDVCAATAQFYTIRAPAFTEAGDDFAASDGSDEAVSEYAKAARWVADGGRAFVASLEAVEVPRDDIETFHEAHTANGRLFIELMDEFAGTLEEYLETHDSATLASALPTYVEHAEAGYAGLLDGFRSLPNDADLALGSVPDCRALVGS